jgi:hypothetical protein
MRSALHRIRDTQTQAHAQRKTQMRPDHSATAFARAITSGGEA